MNSDDGEKPNDKKKPKKPLDLDGLKARLDAAMQFPDVYTFKFIVPRANLNHLIALIDGHRYTERESSGGRYIAITLETVMTSSDDVISFYRRVSVVEGIMSF